MKRLGPTPRDSIRESPTASMPGLRSRPPRSWSIMRQTPRGEEFLPATPGWMPEFRSRIPVVPRTIYSSRESGYPSPAAPPVPSAPRSCVGHAYVSARPSSSGATGRRLGAVGRCQTGVGPVQKSNPSDPTFSDSKLCADRTSPSSTVSLNQESRPHQTQGCSANQLRE